VFKVKKEEFLKEHPSMDGKVYINGPYGYSPTKEWLALGDVHKTQLDK